MAFPIHAWPLGRNTLDPRWVREDIFDFKSEVRPDPTNHCKATALLAMPFAENSRNAVDVGCRDGEFTRYLQTRFQHVYAFDGRRKKSFERNVHTDHATYFVCALGAVAGDITMYAGTHDPDHAKPATVKCFPLDSFNLQDVDFIKIDVEGYERRVLIGSEETIARCRPVIVVEQHWVTLPDEEQYAAKAWLEQRGYRLAGKCPRGYDHIMVPT